MPILAGLIQRYRREETQSFILRVMVGLVILYDHVHPVGAFVKASDVDVSIIKLRIMSKCTTTLISCRLKVVFAF